MPQDLIFYILAIGLAGLLSSFLCVQGMIRIKGAPGGTYFILATLFAAVFTFSYVFELLSGELSTVQFWVKMEYFGLPFIPVFVLLMCFEYIGLKTTLWLRSSLFIIPFLTLYFNHTNELHGLYYRYMGMSQDTPFPILRLEGGPFYYVHSGYSFLCVMLGVVVLLRQLQSSVRRFRIQILLMIIGLLLPLAGANLYMIGLSPYGIDLGPVFMSLSFVLFGISLRYFQMFNVAPIARDSVFESMQDGVLVVNKQRMIVDFNLALVEIFPFLEQGMIGKTVSTVFSINPAIVDILSIEQDVDLELPVENANKIFHLKFTPVASKRGVMGQAVTFMDITERVRMQRQLKELATTDGLTKIWNRTYFMELAEALVGKLHTQQEQFAVVMFDVDHFKQVNDTYGHETGDYVLEHVASLVKDMLRSEDLFGRYGGEEFIICMAGVTSLEAEERSNDIRLAISKFNQWGIGVPITITSSFGVACGNKNKEELKPLIRKADFALYHAKENGRNRVQVYQDEIGSVVQYT
ncbi:hypothetical protein Q75_02170 [Bacillus coahuilensis p1.1.43]|uniref:GGDEF domain-containing protein n=2 Tax=Bacillus coahuilensis TaxID=408580 RepID=A0A147KBR7_9BACI|nr:hypothetical protein Q75_02170 [Bacillus coahuilensis p1.1.43]